MEYSPLPRPHVLIVGKLNAEINKILALPATRTHFAMEFMTITPGTPEDLGETVKRDIARWTKVVRDANLKPE